MADLRGEDFETAVREGTRIAARGIIPWMFGTALRALGPAIDAARVTRTVMYVVNFTRITVGEFRQGYATASGSGIPLVVAPNIANLAIGFYTGILETRGASDVRGRYTDVSIDGHWNSLETVTVRYEFSWIPKRTGR
jgi:hypothetical protein